MKRLPRFCDTLIRMSTNPPQQPRPEGLYALPTKQRREALDVAWEFERAAKERKQTWATLRSYREFADLWAVGVKNAKTFHEFADFIGPAARNLAQEARLLEVMLTENVAAKGRQSANAA